MIATIKRTYIVIYMAQNSLLSFLTPSSGIVVFGAPWCTVCNQCKNYLLAEELHFTYVNFEEHTTKEEFFELLASYNDGYKKVPQVFYNGKFIGGFDKTREFVQSMRKFCLDFSKRMTEQLQNHIDMTSEYNEDLPSDDLVKYATFIQLMRK